jgi:alanine-synthesizing transaminase
MVETIAKPRTNRYSASKGIPGLRKAQAAYYARRFGVKLNPETQIVATLGSKEGFANMAQAITAPGDVILVPSPTYPIHEFGFIISGASIRHIPTGIGETKPESSDPGTAFLRGVERAVKHSIPKPLAMVLSYPSNPTATTVSLDFYMEAVQLAKKLDLIILSDIAYAEIYFDNNPPPSVLQVPGRDGPVTVEFTSLSKTYAMPGWRMGFAVGNERLISALARVKSYLDYGAFTPVQVAAAAGAQRPAGLRRRDPQDLQGAPGLPGRQLARAGWKIPSPARIDVRLGADPRGLTASSAAWNSPSCWSSRLTSRCRRAWASASTARATSASPWWRTSTASGRRRATSKSSSLGARKRCIT